MLKQDVIGEVARQVSEERLLRQIAEEATEVAKAALKTIRALEGEPQLNATEQVLGLNEEVGDLRACLEVAYWKELLNDAYSELTSDAKLRRWLERLRENEISQDSKDK